MARNPLSTLRSALAEVSKNGMPYSSASFWPCHDGNQRDLLCQVLRRVHLGSGVRTSSTDTTRLSFMSHLLAIRILLTCTSAWDWICVTQFRMLSNDFLTIIPTCPREAFCPSILPRQAKPSQRPVSGLAPVGHIVDEEDALGAAKVGRGDGAEAVLSGGVPLPSVSPLATSPHPPQLDSMSTYDLHSDALAIQLDVLYLQRMRKFFHHRKLIKTYV
jgi:hypothetical protein